MKILATEKNSSNGREENLEPRLMPEAKQV